MPQYAGFESVPGSQNFQGTWSSRPSPFFFLGYSMWFVFICYRKDKLYTGITTHLTKRMRRHNAELLYSELHHDKHSAAVRERQIKGWSRGKKMDLIAGTHRACPERGRRKSVPGSHKFLRDLSVPMMH